LNRPVSPILHDYKPSAGQQAKKFDALHWFAVGLGMPLLGIALLLALKNASGTNKPVVEDDVAAAVAIQDFSIAEALPEQTPTGPVAEAIEPVADVAEPVAEAAADPVPFPDFQVPLKLPPEYEQLALTVKRGDTLNALFRKNKLNLGHLAMIVRLPEAAPHLKRLIPGDEFRIEHDRGNVVSLYRELDLTSALKVSREESGFSAEVVDRPIEIKRRLAFGKIETSLFESATAAGLPDRLIMNLAGIFAWDVDFVLDIRGGDHYYILFEEIFQDGEYVIDGKIIAAEFVNNERTFQAIRFVDKDGRPDYYTPEGLSVRKAFVRAPVDFTRISSSFNPRRRHPILNTIRAHRGVDYAAPSGTPIKAAGDGKVIFRGKKNGYGNAIIVQHGGNITTLYAHMSRFNNSSRVGSRVVQGQTIGYVGMTGLATAPHLHYEYRLNGVHRNPRTVKLPAADPIKDANRDDFLAAAAPILQELSQFKTTQVAYLTAD
jgi:murein DD-endopeptidase MepM/ murein hydrolase activator NlpD